MPVYWKGDKNTVVMTQAFITFFYGIQNIVNHPNKVNSEYRES